MLTEAGTMDRPGSYGVYRQSVDQPCLPTGEGERNSGKQAVNDRQNLMAGQTFSDPDACAADAPAPPPGGGGGGGGGGGTIQVTTGAGQCADVGRFSGIYVTHIDCADAQSMETKWAATRGCKTGRKASARCDVFGFTCKAKRRRPKGASVRCSRPNQALRFRSKG